MRPDESINYLQAAINSVEALGYYANKGAEEYAQKAQEEAKCYALVSIAQSLATLAEAASWDIEERKRTANGA